MRSALLVTLCLGLLAACASLRDAPGARWTSRYEHDHPLVGRIWDVAGGRFVDEVGLREGLAWGRFVLLGERHDNPDHHRLQAQMVGWMIAAGRHPAVAFEQFTRDDQPAIDRHLGASPRDAAGLGPAVGWERSGWPEWSLYQPIAQHALDAGLPIVAANLSRADLQTARREGPGGLDPSMVQRLGLDRPLDAATREDMAKEIRDSHCGHAPEAMVDGMVAIQRARDAHMAWRLAQAGRRDGGVLITGTGHARRDRAVPAYLALAEPGATIVSMAILEVQKGDTDPGAYGVRSDRDGRPIYDYVWFTPRVDEGDVCEQFKKSLEKLRQPHTHKE